MNQIFKNSNLEGKINYLIENYRKNIQNTNLHKKYFSMDLSEELKLKIIKRYGWCIKYIKNPTNEMRLAAIEYSIGGAGIKYVDNPTDKEKLFAIKRNGWALTYIKNPTEEMKIEAVKEYPLMLQFIKNPSEEVQLEAFKSNGKIYQNNKNLIEYIKNPSERIQLEAVKQNVEWYKDIKKPTQKVIELYRELNKEKLGSFVEMKTIKKVCIGCKEICYFKFKDGLCDKCPRFIEHLAFQKKEIKCEK